MAAPHWINLGRQAFGLVDDGSLVAVVYWTPADVGEEEGPGGEPVVHDSCFCLVRASMPDRHDVVLEGDESEWSTALARVEDAYDARDA